MRFDGKVVLVTGSEQGIGRSLALGFARHGGKIVVNYPLAPDKAERVLAEAAELGADAMGVRADVRSAEEVAAMVSQVIERFGRIDVLVNNAGIYPLASVSELNENLWDDVLDVNLKGTFLCCRSVSPVMQRQRYGRVINVATTGVWLPRKGTAHYVASKAGIIGFSRVFALEMAPFGVTVNVLAPGLTDTQAARQVFAGGDMQAVGRVDVPLGRIADPEDMVGPALFLASEYSAFVTGQVLLVNGGRFMR